MNLLFSKNILAGPQLKTIPLIATNLPTSWDFNYLIARIFEKLNNLTITCYLII